MPDTALAERPSTTSDPVPPASRSAGVAQVAENFLGVMRIFTKAKARMLQHAQNDVDWAAQALLRSVAAEGPMRASDLAEAVQSDLSTVSRQVAALVKSGLLERRADPVDGRACLLAATEDGRSVIATHNKIRLAYFDRMLADWSPEELHQFARQLDRFAIAYADTNRVWTSDGATEATPEGSSARPGVTTE